MVQREALAGRLTAAGVQFPIEPHLRFKGQPGEQATLLFRDPAGNALEFKAFGNEAALFATSDAPPKTRPFKYLINPNKEIYFVRSQDRRISYVKV